MKMASPLPAPRGLLPPGGASFPRGGPLEKLSPALTFPPELLLRAQGIKVAFFDVDGVLTDGGLYFSEAGETLKRFHTLDGHGIKLLRRVGIEPAVITGRDSKALRARLQALGLVHVHYGTEEKRPAAEKVLMALGLDWQAAAAMGDDWPDLAVMARAALACAPANAHAEAKAIAHHVTASRGGDGAAREFCDLLLAASGRYAELLEESCRG
jgi:3-deoxy-D-manno-octulosonate 8-phosphate phosphatase (KDO 8-P phosphatase)